MLREAENTVNNDAFEGCDTKTGVRTHGCWPARTPLAKNVIAPPPHPPPHPPPRDPSEANKRNIVSVRSIVKEPSCFRDNYFEEMCYLDQGWAEADSGCKQKGP